MSTADMNPASPSLLPSQGTIGPVTTPFSVASAEWWLLCPQGEGHLKMSRPGGVCVCPTWPVHKQCCLLACVCAWAEGSNGNPAVSVAVSTRTSSAGDTRPHLIPTGTHTSAPLADSHIATATGKYCKA